MGSRPMGFASPARIREILEFGPNPAAVFRTSVVDTDLGRRLSGRAGRIWGADPQVTKRTGPLPAQQAFVGMGQLTNLVNAKIGLPTAIPSTKPNPGVVPLTTMQSQLMAMMSQSR